MEQLCGNIACRKKLKQYRELTNKQCDDIVDLETDITEKDAFAQSMVKAKNDYQSEVALLKKKNKSLVKDNDDLLEKVKQLDEDTDDGIAMLRNAHAREGNIKRELDECKENSTKVGAKMENVMKENEELTNKFKFVKEKLEKVLKDNQELENLLTSKDLRIKDIEKDLVCKEHLGNDTHFENYKKTINENEDKLKEQA